ncbi:XdhC family protein [Mycobacteroides salmoniphilum]|uniref:Putative xanthine dehydrogenase subunit A n=1 Tax=Mycobacteroides salmoniphilum TaxID=404941 RepID=A0A4R8SPM2_9MYCO|nr:XdhC/CoxI family protein [Mycobacteroides salmoniphilum]TDZ91074.1 putative xanthine dehydrogenase subunit A [Mycobacteroides salmoniphilum]TEA01020.1 putative xanthine dehydrogenase subunit A [Mycobacteroides salmoniphilum]
MKDILGDLVELIEAGDAVALARVVEVSGAVPREPGAAMIVTADSVVIGSLSGGCVEAAVIEAACEVLETGLCVSERFGVDDGIAPGLTCGGEIEVVTEYVGAERLPLLLQLRSLMEAGEPAALVSALAGIPEWALVRAGEPAPWPQIDGDIASLVRAGRSGVTGADRCEPDQSALPRVFVQAFGVPPRMILAGANAFVRALSRVGSQLGYRVTVVDAREVFATPAQFPHAHQVVVDWPHRYLRAEAAAGRIDGRTVVCVLTHDPKFDVPMLVAALAAPVGFVGALGSRRTHTDRVTRLREDGVTDDQLRRLHSPLGLDLNARTPEETAISIAAQIIAETSGGSGRALSDSDGPIHR